MIIIPIKAIGFTDRLLLICQNPSLSQKLCKKFKLELKTKFQFFNNNLIFNSTITSDFSKL